jgi:hypothetical protein
VPASFTGTTAIRQCRGLPLLVAVGARCGLTLVSGGQISRSCAIAVVPPLPLDQMADPAAMRLIFQLFLNFINYFLFSGNNA